MDGKLDRGGGRTKPPMDLSAWSAHAVLSRHEADTEGGETKSPETDKRNVKESATPGPGNVPRQREPGIRTRKVKNTANYEIANQRRGSGPGTSVSAKRIREIREQMKDRIEELRLLVAPEDTGKRLLQTQVLERAIQMLEGVDAETLMLVDQQAVLTQQKKKRNELGEPKLEGLQDLILVTDVTGRIVFALESGNYSLGFSAEELQMGNIVDLVHWSEATSVQEALSQKTDWRLRLRLRDAGLSFRSYHFLVHPVVFNNQRLMIFSGRYAGPTNNMGLKLLAMGNGTPARYYKAWSLNHVAINAVVVWSGNAMDTVCGYPAMYMTTVMPFVFVHPDDIAALVEIHKAAVVDKKVGVMNNRLFSRHGSWVMTENTIYPCINRNTGKVEYTITEGVHTDNMSTEPMDSMANENRVLPYQPIYYDDMDELVQRCTELSLQGRREFEQLIQQAEQIDTRHIMMEHSRLLTFHYPDRVRELQSSNQLNSARALPFSAQPNQNQRLMQSAQIPAQSLVDSRSGFVNQSGPVENVDFSSRILTRPIPGATSEVGYSSGNSIAANMQPQSANQRKEMPKEILPHNERTFGQPPDLFSVLRAIAVPEGDIYSIVMGLDAMAQDGPSTTQQFADSINQSPDGLSSDFSTSGGSNSIFSNSNANTFRYRHQDFLPRPNTANQPPQTMFPDVNNIFRTNPSGQMVDDNANLFMGGTSAVPSGFMQNNRNSAPRNPNASVATSDTESASLSVYSSGGKSNTGNLFNNGIPPSGIPNIGSIGVSAEAELDIALMAELMASGGAMGLNFGISDSNSPNSGHNEPMQNTPSNGSVGSTPSMATHATTSTSGTGMNNQNRLFGQAPGNPIGLQDPDVEYLLEIMKQAVDKSPDQSQVLLNSLSGATAARQNEVRFQQGNKAQR